jgi:hypothetical protein
LLGPVTGSVFIEKTFLLKVKGNKGGFDLRPGDHFNSACAS